MLKYKMLVVTAIIKTSLLAAPHVSKSTLWVWAIGLYFPQ